MFDFGLNRWVTLLSATAAAIFGGTFLLQFVADLTDIAALDWLAFDVLGQQLERILPDVVYVWFAALLLTGSTGFSRLVGWVVVPLLFGLEIAHPRGRPVRDRCPVHQSDDLRAVRLAAARVREAPLVARRGAAARAGASRGGRLCLTPSPADGRLLTSAAAGPCSQDRGRFMSPRWRRVPGRRYRATPRGPAPAGSHTHRCRAASPATALHDEVEDPAAHVDELLDVLPSMHRRHLRSASAAARAWPRRRRRRA